MNKLRIVTAMLPLLMACTESDVATRDPVTSLSDQKLLPELVLSERVAVTDTQLSNLEAPVPPQCYTRTEQRHNPCYVCHQQYPQQPDAYRMNKLNDGYLQGGYRFSDVGEKNHWSNLFVDKSDFVRKISDTAITRYVEQDNYSQLAERLRERSWSGFIPDLDHYQRGAQAFDAQGFALDGSQWVAFNYKPFPSTFWPSNGSTDDVLIRLPAAFRELAGQYSRDLYLANLTLLEMNIKDLQSLSSPPLNEHALQIDLNQDGLLQDDVRQLKRQSHYWGDARDVALLPQQYPSGTEFLHSVRYLGVGSGGEIRPSTRMKELRYMRKIRGLSDHELQSRYARERKDKFEEKLPRYVNLGERGFENGLGWLIQGYIEDYAGELRPQSYEERMFCMGCHSAIGSTIDQVFSFARKQDGATGWGYINLKGMRDAPNISGGDPEILEYLRRVGGGDEFRENAEMQRRWFVDGELDEEAVRAADVYDLITPSPERAAQLNKAYSYIVRHQSYIYGRDANLLPAHNVYRQIDESKPPLQGQFRLDAWDMRLNWSE